MRYQPTAVVAIAMFVLFSQAQTNANAIDLRLRGNPDDVIHSKDSPLFSSTSSASIGITSNRIIDQRTVAFQAALGYGLLSTESISITPFASGQVITSKSKGSPEEVTSKIASFGAASTYKGPVLGLPSIINVMPYYMMNFEDDSRLAAVHSSWTPTMTRCLNDPIRLSDFFKGRICSNASTEPDKDDITATLRFDTRFNAGFFTNRGLDPIINQDYARLGIRAGITIKGSWFDISFMDTYARGLSGYYKNTNHYVLSASFYFGTSGNIGINASWRKGRQELSGIREDLIGINLTARY